MAEKDHDHGHGHSHSHEGHDHSGHGHHHHHHGHGHHHGTMDRLSLAFFLNFGFAIVELVGGFYTNSVSIMSNSLHDFGDSLSLLLALGLEKFSQKKSDEKYSYGYKRYSSLAAVCTGVILIVGSLFILIEAVPRLLNPSPTRAGGMVLLAFLGIAVNGFAALRISKGTSLSERMIMWHFLEDLMGWMLILVSGTVMYFWPVPQLDAALACVLAMWIVYNVFKNLREAFSIFLQATPGGVNQERLSAEIHKIPLVEGVHHSHVWSLDGENHVFTTHLVLSDQVTHPEIDEIKKQVKNVAAKFRIMESTIEIEFRSSQCVDPEH